MDDFLSNNILNQKEYLKFNKLCDTAKGILFDWLFTKTQNSYCIDAIHYNGIFSQENTAIEQIFIISYYRYIFTELIKEEKYFNVPISAIFSEFLFNQENINFENHHYIADFVFDLSRKKQDGNYLFPEYKDLKYVIELDGFEYHSSKAQVNYDYRREQDLQSIGYKIIRFTGSQLFKDPHSCIVKLIKIILNDIKGAYKNGSI